MIHRDGSFRVHAPAARVWAQFMEPARLSEIISDPHTIETPNWETAKTTTPSPHHPLGAKGIGESATVGAPAAIANAVLDALAPYGVTNIDIPIHPWKVWQVIHGGAKKG